MNLSMFKNGVLGVALSCLASFSYAEGKAIGGVSLGATRVIYPMEAKQVSLSVINHSKKDRYLINSWVENKKEEKVKNFLVTPPLFVAEPATENTLRIVSLVKILHKIVSQFLVKCKINSICRQRSSCGKEHFTACCTVTNQAVCSSRKIKDCA